MNRADLVWSMHQSLGCEQVCDYLVNIVGAARTQLQDIISSNVVCMPHKFAAVPSSRSGLASTCRSSLLYNTYFALCCCITLQRAPASPGGSSIAKQFRHATVGEFAEGTRCYQTRRVVVCRLAANSPTGACPNCFAILLPGPAIEVIRGAFSLDAALQEEHQCSPTAPPSLE